MPSKKEVFAKLVGLLNEKTGGQQPCAVCGKQAWRLQESFIHMPVAPHPNAVRLGGEGFPMWPIVCGNCGNTLFLNLLVLGVKDLDELRIEPDADK